MHSGRISEPHLRDETLAVHEETTVGSRDAYSSLQRDGKQYATLRFTRDHQLVLLLRPKSTKFVLVVRPISHKVHAVGDGCIKWIQGCVGCCWGCGNLSELKFGKIESSH